MQDKALVIIDMQNDITKNYREIIDPINRAIQWAAASGIHVVYIRFEALSPGARIFLPGTSGAALVPELEIVSDHIFVKNKQSSLSSEEFSAFIEKNGINQFFLAGADATACVKSTCYGLRKAGYAVTVLSDCITSYNKAKIDEMLAYYGKQGAIVISLCCERTTKKSETLQTDA